MIRCRECRAILDAKALVCGSCRGVIPKGAERFSPLEDEFADCKTDAVISGASGETDRTGVLLVQRLSAKDRVVQIVVTSVLATLVMVGCLIFALDCFLPVFGGVILVFALCSYKMGVLVGETLGERETKPTRKTENSGVDKLPGN